MQFSIQLTNKVSESSVVQNVCFTFGKRKKNDEKKHNLSKENYSNLCQYFFCDKLGSIRIVVLLIFFFLVESSYLNQRCETVRFLASCLRLRWLNTVLAGREYMSFAKSWQRKGCSSQAETWQVKNILMQDSD